MMWTVPEGAEAFGQGRRDIEWLDDSKKAK
jgi:hypothetical protein